MNFTFNMMMLVVDSNKEERSRLKRELTKFCDVVTLSSAREALAFSRSQTVDIVLMPVQHWNLSSKSTANLIQHFSDQQVLIFAIPEEDSGVGEDVYINYGFAGVLRKPALFPELVDQVYPFV